MGFDLTKEAYCIGALFKRAPVGGIVGRRPARIALTLNAHQLGKMVRVTLTLNAHQLGTSWEKANLIEVLQKRNGFLSL